MSSGHAGGASSLSGRSPFPATRTARTRLAARNSLENNNNSNNNNNNNNSSMVDESTHSPFLQGLLRFSPNNNSHWSPRPGTGRGKGGSFFAANAATPRDRRDKNTQSNQQQLQQQQQQQQNVATTPPDANNADYPSPPTQIVDGIPIDRLRALTQDSLLHSPSQATFFASLVYAKTNHPQDALLLAKTHLQDRNWNACLRILEESALLQTDQPWQALLLACAALAAQDEWPSVVQLLEDACRLPEPSQNAHPAIATHHHHPAIITTSRPLQDDDEFGWHVLQEAIPRTTTAAAAKQEIHVLARVCCWRGKAYHETGNNVRAALYWKRALHMDPKCQEAYEALLERHLITSQEAYQLVQELDFTNEEDWLRSLYLARIELVAAAAAAVPNNNSNSNITTTSASANAAHMTIQNTPAAAAAETSFALDASAIPFSSPTFQTPADGRRNEPLNLATPLTTAKASTREPSPMQKDVDQAFDKLMNEHKLQNSPHVLAMAARRSFRRYQWKQTLHYAEQLAQLDPNITGAAFCYLSALVLLGHKQVLFRLGHEWVEAHPKSAQAWFAIGAYYYACQRYHVAQRHFCRATRLDPQCTPAWIAFGCSFAACDESDQALASFRAAQRLSPGEHTSLLYMGMEYVRTNHLVLAQYFLHAAATSSGGDDPLCWHELGIWHLQKGDYGKALDCLTAAVAAVSPDGVEGVKDAYWEPTVLALGHVYRRTRHYDKALECYQRSVSLCSETASAWTALALCQHLMHNLDAAIESYHEALSWKADDPVGTEMLQRALEEQASAALSPKEEEEEPAVMSSSLPPPATPGSILMSSMDMSEASA